MYERQIAEKIRQIAGVREDGTSSAIMMGLVVAGSVDMDNLLCDVVLTGDDEEHPTQGVLLNSAQGINAGITLIPADDSVVWVAELDGPGKWGVVKCGKLLKMLVTVGSSTVEIKNGEITLNDGSLGGLVKVEELVTRLNNLEDDINNLKTVFSTGWVVVPSDGGSALKLAAATWAAQQLTDTQRGDIENTNIKQG